MAAVLAGCTTGPTEVAPGTTGTPHTPNAPAASGSTTTAAPAPSRSAPTPTPEGTLLVADFGSDTVTFVDPGRDGSGRNGGPIASVEVGTAPYGLVVGEDGRAWVATAEGVAVVDTQRRTRLALIPYETETGPVTTGEYRGGGMGIALAPDGRHVYVGVNVPGGNGTLEVVDTATREVTGVVGVGRRPFDVDVSPDGREVYATNHDSFDVTAVDPDTLRTRRMEVAPYGTEGGLGSWLKPHYAVVRPQDGRLLLPFEGERLAVLDPRSGKVTIERMTAGTHQHGAALAPDGTLLVVGTGPIGSADGAPPSRSAPRTARSGSFPWRGRTRTWRCRRTEAPRTSPEGSPATATGTASPSSNSTSPTSSTPPPPPTTRETSRFAFPQATDRSESPSSEPGAVRPSPGAGGSFPPPGRFS